MCPADEGYVKSSWSQLCVTAPPKEQNHEKGKLTASKPLSVNNAPCASAAESWGQSTLGMKGPFTRVDSCPESLQYGHKEDVHNRDLDQRWYDKNKAAQSK